VVSCTSVKNQADTSTCWCFATNSFLEAELLRKGKGEIDLSEMFVVRHIYPMKADAYVRRHGAARIAGGGLTNNVIRVLRQHGAAPEAAYPGKVNDLPHNQDELDRLIKAMLDAVVKSKKVNPAWRVAVDGTLDAYLGELPEQVEFDGQQFTPIEFAKHLELDPDDYVQLTSYTHKPFFREIVLEIPDNWAGDRYWNVPIDDLMTIMSQSIEKGFSVAWGGDISERSCKRTRGIAILPAKSWWKKTTKERERLCKSPESELEVTQEIRQKQFDDFRSTDDHLMHLVGLSHDCNGTRYFVVKDSYGTLNHDNEGLINMSQSYMRAKTVAILVHKDVLPRPLAEKLGIAQQVAEN